MMCPPACLLGVYQIDGGALASRHPFINGAPNMNNTVYQAHVYQPQNIVGRQAGGHQDGAEISHSSPLSTIFLLKTEKRRIEREKRSPKGYAREEWTGRQGLPDPDRHSLMVREPTA